MNLASMITQVTSMSTSFDTMLASYSISSTVHLPVLDGMLNDATIAA